MDLFKLYQDQILPNLRWNETLSNFNPSDKGNYFNIDCPKCGQHEAVIYKNSGVVKCNRQNQCQHDGNLLGLMNGGDQPTGSKYIDIIKQLCDLSGVAFPNKEYEPKDFEKFEERNRKQDLFKRFMTICVNALYESEVAIAYLDSRGISKEKLKSRNDIGFYPDQAFIKQELEKKGYLPTEIHESGLIRSDWDGRIIFSIEERGKIGDFIAGYIKPTVQSEKKYLRMNGAKAYDKSALLGLHKAEKDIILVEGVFDYLSLDDAGIKNVVALGGCSLWDEHIRKLDSHKVKNITLLLDNDDAGVNGTIKIIEKLN